MFEGNARGIAIQISGKKKAKNSMSYDIRAGQMGKAESRRAFQLIPAEDPLEVGDDGFRCLGRHGPYVNLAGKESGKAGWHIGIESGHQICSHAISRTVPRLIAVIYTKSVTAAALTALLEYSLGARAIDCPSFSCLS